MRVFVETPCTFTRENVSFKSSRRRPAYFTVMRSLHQGNEMPNAEWELDRSSWPIVHGSRESLDYTSLPTPLTAALHFYNSQGLSPSARAASSFTMLRDDTEGVDDKKGEEEEGKVYRRVIDAMRELLLAKGQEDGARAVEDAIHAYMRKGGKRFSMANANPVSIITERVNEQEQRLWTSGFKHVLVFRQVLGAPTLELLAEYEHGGFDFHYHGSYSFVAKSKPESSEGGREGGGREGGRGEGSRGKPVHICGCGEARHLHLYIDGKGRRGGKPEGEDLREDGAEDGAEEDDESNSIVGVTLTEDGTVVVAAKGGNVTALRHNPSLAASTPTAQAGESALRPVAYFPLSRVVASSAPIHISNSLAVHGQGVYIVTQEEMVRLDMDTSSASLKFRWATPYGRGGLPWYTSRLGPGSGSTPSLTSCQGRDMVVITDGELRMNLIYLDAETGGEGGCKAFVVNNYVGTDGLDADTQCTDAPGVKGKEELAAFCNMLQPTFISKVCPAVFGCMAYGAAMYTLDEEQKALKQLWARDDVSCGTSIPLISGPSDGSPSSTYCVGMLRNSSRWTLLALDTETGEERFRFPYYSEGKDRVANFFGNPYYAGVEAVAPGTLAMGSIGGLIYLTPTGPTSRLHSPPSAVASSASARPASAARVRESRARGVDGNSIQALGLVGIVMGLVLSLGLLVRAWHRAKQNEGRARRRAVEGEDGLGGGYLPLAEDDRI
ncbi:Stress-induced protein SRP1/TIP1 [Nannochloropsis gaditana]|uniref:Stress-induced protein SRP1/TIP1 n=1 Tax=Nannochloropsis gaditana TaxID=72520 RepID=W7TFK2_9STRA|nr:Stress-induced protein SRP1/TIP1 [Nannochloropsis gaditana]